MPTSKLKKLYVEPTPKMQAFVWSPSKLATFVGNTEWEGGCGVRTYLDYFAGPTYDVASHYFTFGTFVHEVLELYHATPEQPSYDQVLTWAKELWIASIYKKNITKKFGSTVLEKLEKNIPVSFSDLDRDSCLVSFEDLEFCYSKVNMIDELLKGTATRWMFLGYGSAQEEKDYNAKAYDIFKEYYARPYIQPVSLEMFLSLLFDGVQVRGRVDRIDGIGDKNYCVVDYKTSKKPKKGQELNKDFQMVCYHNAAIEAFGVKNEQVEVGLLFLCPQQKVKGVYQPMPMTLNKTQITDKDIKQATEAIVTADRLLKSGEFHYVANSGKWQCPYCDHYQKCGR